MQTSNLLFKLILSIMLLAMINTSAQQSALSDQDRFRHNPGPEIKKQIQTEALHGVRSSDTIWQEDFTPPTTDWTVEGNWDLSNPDLRFLASPTVLNFDMSAISPTISLPANVSDFTFTIGNFVYYGVDEKIEVIVVHNTGEDVIYSYEFNLGATGIVNHLVSLVPYANQDIEMKFRCYGSSTANMLWYLQIDDLIISADYDDDLSISDFTGNFAPLQNTTETYTVEVFNSGMNTQNSYTVKMMQEGNIVLGTASGVELAHNDTAYFEFDWTPTVAGATYIWAEVVLAGDEDPDDNIMQKDVTVIPAAATTSQVTIEVTVDLFYSEATWNIWNISSETYYFQDNQGFTESFQTITEVVDLYDGDYQVHCFDGAGNGGIAGTVSNADDFVLASWPDDHYQDLGEFDFPSYNLDDDLWARHIHGNLTPSVNYPSIYKITIVNMGANTQSFYTVRLMKEGNIELNSVMGVELDQYESHEFELVWTPDAEGETHIWGEVVLVGDQHPQDNFTNSKNIDIWPEGTMTITIGDGEKLDANPVAHNWNCSLSEQIYLEGELEPGVIKTIQMYTNFPENPEACNITVWLGETSWAQFDTATQELIPSTELTEVYSGNPGWEVGDGIVNIQLTSPFTYTENNLVMMVKNLYSQETYSWYCHYYNTLDNAKRSIEKWSFDDIDETNPLPVTFGYNTWSQFSNVSFLYDYPTYQTEIIESEIDIFPNPSSDQITIKVNSNIKQIKMFDLVGKRVKQLSASGNLLNMDVSDVETGVYIIKILSSDNLISRKVVIK